jgi:DNA-binding LytR/AlgR family response regulator
MNILLIEDEAATARQIKKMVLEVEPDYNIVYIAESIKESIAWLQANPKPDLILSDIELGDGISFDIFRYVKTIVPVIFITAYNAYMQQAFKVNSIDYLLKPLEKEELVAAFAKYKLLAGRDDDTIQDKLAMLLQDMNKKAIAYKSRFLVKVGERLSTVPVQDVIYLRADDKIVFLHTAKQKHIIDESLDALEQVLDPMVFFRLNRRYIAPMDSIKQITTHFNGKLKITLAGADDNEIFVSREKASAFKEWLGG